MRWKAECIILKSLNSKCYLLALLLSSWNDPAHCLKWDNHGLDIVTLPASDPSPDHTHPEYFLGKGSDQHRALCKWGSSLQALTYTLKSSSSRSAPNTLSICSWNHRYHRKAYAVINTCSEMFIELRLWRPFKGPKSLKVVHEENLGGGGILGTDEEKLDAAESEWPLSPTSQVPASTSGRPKDTSLPNSDRCGIPHQQA